MWLGDAAICYSIRLWNVEYMIMTLKAQYADLESCI